MTIELQIISKDANKLISDTDGASRNLAKTQEALARLDQLHGQTTPPGNLSPSFPFPIFSLVAHENTRQRMIDTLQYLHSSMDKQKMWLHNYRDRKDIAMSLVFNLVTQQDAANNIGIAKEMKRDSSSMNGIALLTMVFLPGTFTSVSEHFYSVSFKFFTILKPSPPTSMEDDNSELTSPGTMCQTVLGAGIFSSYAQNRDIHVQGLWWFWAAVTFPLTGVVLVVWGLFCWRKEIQERWRRMILVGKKGSRTDDVEAKG